MNIKEKIVVLRNTEDGSFLKSFKNKKDVLAYNVELTDGRSKKRLHHQRHRW
ncbi:TPA: hypothetical protein VDC63_000697 [Streptococcus pyogenes]|nr:hypothetical protein [Streptococcus pyogenes]